MENLNMPILITQDEFEPRLLVQYLQHLRNRIIMRWNGSLNYLLEHVDILKCSEGYAHWRISQILLYCCVIFLRGTCEKLNKRASDGGWQALLSLHYLTCLLTTRDSWSQKIFSLTRVFSQPKLRWWRPRHRWKAVEVIYSYIND
jgi:hypothetical protein